MAVGYAAYTCISITVECYKSISKAHRLARTRPIHSTVAHITTTSSGAASQNKLYVTIYGFDFKYMYMYMDKNKVCKMVNFIWVRATYMLNVRSQEVPCYDANIYLHLNHKFELPILFTHFHKYKVTCDKMMKCFIFNQWNGTMAMYDGYVTITYWF